VQTQGGIHSLPGSKILFANQLRGVAALSVVLIHYTVVVQLLRRDIAWVIAAPPIEGPVPAIVGWLDPVHFDLGTFGVSLFFLISGFVIPFSLQTTTSLRFLLARAVRIYPAFWVALLVEGLAVWLSAGFWHRDSPYGIRNYVVNGLLIETLLGEQTVDWVSWTLSIEVKFYILAAILRPAILKCRVWPLLAVAALAAAVNLSAAHHIVALPVELVSEATYIVFILIGTLFNYHYQKSISSIKLACYAFLLMLIVVFSWAFGPMLGDWKLKTSTMAVALIVFAVAYAYRSRFRPSVILDGLAAISYPLYLVHALFGFTLLSFLMMAWRIPYLYSAIIAFLSSGALAYALHCLVERPSVRLGSMLKIRAR
jgi:peptidoglycan/LPS O-acetylase OafA/YrhL